ncbi:hypothetical protein PENSPDRAFT_690051 [Peniophora sp. CONT]|nr:hypothetical protein PENSPDRAFT_690051 [Peniophora sp. CONT]
MDSEHKAVVAVSSSTAINAPRHVVRDVLLGFASYPEWSKSFVSQVVLLDSKRKPLADQRTPAATGSWVRVTACLPNTTSTHVNDEVILELDAETGTLAWRYVGYWGALTAERIQTLHEAEDGTTVYKTHEDFWGPFAWILKWTSVPNLQAAFDVFGKELKERAESLK